MSGHDTSYPSEVNLENCAKEPIHIIGKSQAHGVLVICDPESLTIRQIGTNARDLFLIDHDALLEKPLSSLLGDSQTSQFQKALEANELSVPRNVEIGKEKFLLMAHLSDIHLILDFEPLEELQEPFFCQKQLTRIMNQLQNQKSIKDVCNSAAELTKKIFRYDRVMIYKFDEDWNGEVLAEQKEPEMESWLGLHYPATDIPEQSRAMFLKHKVRVITDVNYKPVPLKPELSPHNGAPVDLTRSNLRAVSPIHIEYLKNMEVGASLSASIAVKGKLWGLIACHHREAKFVDHYQRESCRFLAQMLSTEITLLEAHHFLKRRKISEGRRKKLVAQMQQSDNIAEALTEGKIKLIDLIFGGGATFFLKDRFYFCGETPNEEQVEYLLENLLKKEPKSLFFTHHLSALFPQAEEYADVASGVLSLRVSENKYIIWFRPEVLQTINWGGNPNKKGFYNEEKKRISPRKSFQKFSEKLTGTSEPWQDFDLSIARSLREDISHIVLAKQRKEIETLNEKLVEANKELELFSYGLSHDLRAPIRGMEGYLTILDEDYSSGISIEGKQMIQKTRELAEKMNRLVDDILAYSSLNHSGEMKMTVVPVKVLIEEILEFFNTRANYPKAVVRINEDLPAMYGDKRMLFQLWSNLLNNALKYSAEKEHPEISVGFIENGEAVTYYVQDNGIGVKNGFLEKIFDTFSRVAGSRYKGSGIGLAIAKKIIEKHEGRIWAESSPGEGAKFLFKLGTDNRLERENDHNSVTNIVG